MISAFSATSVMVCLPVRCPISLIDRTISSQHRCKAAQPGAVDVQYAGGAVSCQPLAVQEPEVRHANRGASPHVHLPTVGEHAPSAIGTSGGQATLVVPLAPEFPLVPPPTAPLPLVPPSPLPAFAPAPPMPVRPPGPLAAPPFETEPPCPPAVMAPPLPKFPSPPIPGPSAREPLQAVSVSRLSGRSARDHCRRDIPVGPQPA